MCFSATLRAVVSCSAGGAWRSAGGRLVSPGCTRSTSVQSTRRNHDLLRARLAGAPAAVPAAERRHARARAVAVLAVAACAALRADFLRPRRCLNALRHIRLTFGHAGARAAPRPEKAALALVAAVPGEACCACGGSTGKRRSAAGRNSRLGHRRRGDGAMCNVGNGRMQ